MESKCSMKRFKERLVTLIWISFEAGIIAKTIRGNERSKNNFLR